MSRDRLDDDDDAQCRVLGGVFSFVVQAALAAICLAVLLFKRWRENPRRPWLVWCFDLSKQVFSSGLQHLANLVFGVVLARDGASSQCAWYFVLYVITSTAAVFVVAAGMAAMNWVVRRYDLTMLRTGEYGSPPSWRPWLAQLLVWGAIGIGEKLLTTFTLVVPFRHPLGRLAHWLEGPLLPYPHYELIIVMVVTPVLLNVISVVVFDNIMKPRRRAGSGARSSLRDPLVDDGWSLAGAAMPDAPPARAPGAANGAAHLAGAPMRGACSIN